MFTLAIGTFQILLIVLGGLLVLLFPVLALFSVLKKDFSGSDKFVWIAVILLLPFIGASLYFLIGGGRQRKRQ